MNRDFTFAKDNGKETCQNILARLCFEINVKGFCKAVIVHFGDTSQKFAVIVQVEAT